MIQSLYQSIGVEMNILITIFMDLSLSPHFLIVTVYDSYTEFVKMCKFMKLSEAWCFPDN